MDYKKIFKKSLMSELSQVDTSPEANDSDLWKNQNQTIVDDPKLSQQFEVEGIPVKEAEKYIKKINEWRGICNGTSNRLEEVYNFASEKADKEGADQIYKSINGVVENIVKNLGTLEGQLRTLGNKVKVKIKQINQKKVQG